jgi:hypothetical protein
MLFLSFAQIAADHFHGFGEAEDTAFSQDSYLAGVIASFSTIVCAADGAHEDETHLWDAVAGNFRSVGTAYVTWLENGG